MKTTARDIANICGTSLSAVSRAFRADSVISKDLRLKILAAASEHGYAPPARRDRRHRDALSIAIVIGELENPFNALALKHFATSASEAGWDMVTFVVPETGDPDGLMEQVLASDLDVLVLAAIDLSTALAKACRNRGLPVVFFNRVQVDPEMTAICTDNYGGGRLAGERLLAQNRETIAYVGGRLGTSTHLERRRGFIDALTEAGSELRYDELGHYDYDTANQIGHRLFAGPQRPDGVFCANDNMAFAMIDAADTAGLRPGVDVSIIGYDDVPLARWTRYELTTISQQLDQMVARAIQAIRRVATNGGDAPGIEIVPAKMVVRGSG